MLGVSTGWRSQSISDGAKLLDALLAVGAEAIELEYRITRSTFDKLYPILKREGITVTSIHNFFPAPDGLAQGEGSGELYLFSSDDPDERRLAVKYTVRAMEIAYDLGARAIVVHLGHVPMVDPTRKLKVLYDQGKIDELETKAFIEKKMSERRLLSRSAIDNALLCLDELNRAGERIGVYVGLENRYHFSEVPDFEDFRILLGEFPAESMVRYWHDVGHAEANKNLGFGDSRGLLESYGHQLVGMHLHDVSGHRDHARPGDGTVDWELIKRFIAPETIRVMELAPERSVEDALAGMAFLDDIGIR